MTIDQANEVHNLAAVNDFVGAANLALGYYNNPARVTNNAQGVATLRKLCQSFLDNDMYLHAASMLWGPDMFNAKPESVQRVFKAIANSSKIMLCGASSMSKSYSGGVYMALDYLRDPYFTTVKLAAVNEDHLKKNLFAHVAKLFRNMSFPFNTSIIVRDSDLWIGIKEAGYEFGISGIAFKQSQEKGGQFKGYKSLPARKVPHPQFGTMSRLRVLLDEGQDAPGGPFQDFNSLYASVSDNGVVKVVVAYNPVSPDREVCRLSEPEEGWNIDQLDTLYDYESRAGWRVCRLDAALSENVKQKKVVYPGLQTYQGYIGYLKSGGDNSPFYMCFARGLPPMQGSVNVIIPMAWPQQARGEATFIETPKIVAAVDLAFMGEDTAQMAIGRWGLASGYTPQSVEIINGQATRYIQFMDKMSPNRPKPHHVLQIDQIIPLSKHDDTIKMANEIIGRCKQLGVSPENLGVDRTGIGQGTYDHLRAAWGDVIGISWNEKATDRKILSDDVDTAYKQCDGIVSEMWWAFRRWIDPSIKAVLINPIIQPQPINTQMTSRRFTTGKNGIKVESKESYKSRNNRSPDEADALIELVHVVRAITDVLPGLVEKKKMANETSVTSYQSVKDAHPISFTEQDDSMSENGEDE